MAIKFVPAPDDSLNELKRGLIQRNLCAHAVYLLENEDLANGKGVEAAQLIAWRYFLSKTPTVAEVNHSPSGTAYAGLRENSACETTPEVFNRIKDIPAVSAVDFEPRLLRVPGLHALALWLYDLSGKKGDLFFPVRRIANFFEQTQYSRADFESLLQQIAKRKSEDQPSRAPANSAPEHGVGVSAAG